MLRQEEVSIRTDGKLSIYATALGRIVSYKFRVVIGHELFWVSIVALFLRFLLMPYFSTIGDPYFWARSLIYFNNGLDPYLAHISVYPPFIYLLYSPYLRFVEWLGFSGSFFYFIPPLGQTVVTPFFLVVWKIPLLIFDFLVGFLIYRIFKEASINPKIPKLAFLVWIFNPLNLVITYMHGGWDLIVGFMILLGIFLVYKRNYLIGGLCFGLGTLTKLAPVYLLPPFFALLLLRGSRDSGFFSTLRTNISSLLKFVLGFALPFLVFAPLIFSYAKLASYLPFSSSEGFIYNNLNEWFFVAHPAGFGWANSILSLIQKMPFVYVAVSVLLVFVLFRGNKLVELSLKKLLLFGSLFCLLSFVFYPSMIQSQYLLWYLPLLTCLVLLGTQLKVSYAILSVSVIFYYFASQGPVTPLAPLAVYSGVFSVEQYQSGFAWFSNLPTFITGISFQKDLLFVSGLLSFVAMLIMIYTGGKMLWREKD